jgi:hypothetical protein
LVKDGRLFPSPPVHETKVGRPTFYGNDLKLKLVELGAPADFTFHAWQHTIATFLEDAGHSEWERRLVLKPSGSRSITAGYSHGYPLELKRKLLTERADDVGDCAMRLGDLDVYDLIDALGMERSAWINVQKERNRRLTDAERVTICVLAAFERALLKVASTQEGHNTTEEAKRRVDMKARPTFDDAVLDGLARAIDEWKS